MNEEENIFEGAFEDIEQVDYEPLEAELASESELDYYPIVVGQYGRQAKEENNREAAVVFGFIGVLLEPLPNFHSPSEPFRPMRSGVDSRSFLYDDLTNSDLEALEILVKKVSNSVLKARFYDFLFLRRANYKFAAEAATAYHLAAKRFDKGGSWISASVCFLRALQLASKMGRDKPLFSGITSGLSDAVQRRSKEEKEFGCYRYMKEMLQFELGDPVHFAGLSREIAKRALAEKDYWRARHYYQVETEWHRQGKDQAKADEADLLGAEVLVADAEHDVEVRNNHHAASTKLAQAIEAMIRNGTAGKERITELKTILQNHQKKTIDGFTKVREEVNVAEQAKKAASLVSGLNFSAALERLAFINDLVNLEELKQVTLDVTRNSLREFVTAQQLDEDGKPIRNMLSLPAEGSPDYEEILEQKMFEFAGNCIWKQRVLGVIEPARQKIEEEHHPILSDLEHVVVNNPFVPPNHELIFLRGLHAGLHGDFLMCCHFLVPQVENSVRYILEQNGVDIVTMKGHGLQEVKTLGTLLKLPMAIKLFGAVLCFELRGALAEKASHDLRNRVAHGFVTHYECESISGRHVWWLILRICLALHLNSVEEESSHRPIQPLKTNGDGGA